MHLCCYISAVLAHRRRGPTLLSGLIFSEGKARKQVITEQWEQGHSLGGVMRVYWQVAYKLADAGGVWGVLGHGTGGKVEVSGGGPERGWCCAVSP